MCIEYSQPHRTEVFMRALLFSILHVIGCGSVYANDWPITVDQAQDPHPFHYDASLWKHVPTEYLQNAEACMLFASSVHLIEADGTIESTIHDVTRLNSRNSIENLGEYRRVVFHPNYEKLTLNRACIHKQDGRTVKIEPRHVHLRDSSTDFETYNPTKTLVISFPGLEVGDVIDVKWTTRGKSPEQQGKFYYRYQFGAVGYPIVQDEFIVRIPKGTPFHHATVNGTLRPKIHQSKKQIAYRWIAKNIDRLPRDPDRPSNEEFRLQVCCSTFKDWKEVAQWKAKLRQHCWQCTPQIRKLVQRLTKGLTNPIDKARVLTHWVKQNLRYVGKGEYHDYTPHPPARVFLDRQGDCKDGCQLLAVMLKEVGIPTSFVTLGTRGDGQVLKNVPSAWGTHALLMITIDNQRHWIDTTATLAGWNVLPINSRDRDCYVTNDKDIHFTRTPTIQPNDHKFEQYSTVHIGLDGTTYNTRIERTYGLAAYHQRNRWLKVSVGEREHKMLKSLREDHNQAELESFEIDDRSLEDVDHRMRSKVKFTIPHHFTGKSKLEASFSDGRVWNYLLAYNAASPRTVPLELYTPTTSTHKYTITSAAGFEPDGLPKSKTIQSRWGSFSRKLRWGKTYRTVHIEFTFQINQIVIQPEEMNEFRQFHKEVKEYYRVWIALEKVNHLQNVPALEVVRAFVPMDVHSAKTLARIYLHHGQFNDAERILAQARTWRPDEKSLWELSLKAANTLKKKLSIQRQLVERFLDDPSQVVALASLLIEQGRHELAQPVLSAMAKTSTNAVRFLAYHQLARSLTAQKKYKQALAQLKEAERVNQKVKLKPLAIHLLRGRIYEEQKNYDASIVAYEDALKLEKTSKAILTALIRVAKANGDHPQSLRYLRRYLVTVGDDFHAMLDAADLCLSLSRFDDAEELALRARQEKFHVDVQRILGLVAFHRKDYQQAVHHLTRCDPTPEVIAGLIQSYIPLGELREAERQWHIIQNRRIPIKGQLILPLNQLKELLARRNDLLSVIRPSTRAKSVWIIHIDLFVCAEHAHRHGQITLAKSLVDQALDGKTFGAALALRAEMFLTQGQLIEAFTQVERALEMDVTEARAWFVRGRIYQEREQAQEAVTDLEKAVALSQHKNVPMLKALSQAQWQAGFKDRARQTIDEALRIAPSDIVLKKLSESYRIR